MKKVIAILGFVVGILMVVSSFLSGPASGREMYIFQQIYLLIERIGGIVIILLAAVVWPSKQERDEWQSDIKEIRSLLARLEPNMKKPAISESKQQTTSYSKSGDYEGIPRKQNESDSDYWKRVANSVPTN